MKILLFCFLFFFISCVPLAQEGDFKDSTTLSTQASVQAPSTPENNTSKEEEKTDNEDDTSKTAEESEEDTDEEGEELAGEFDYKEFPEQGSAPLTERL